MKNSEITDTTLSSSTEPMSTELSASLTDNISALKRLLPIGKSFDLITRRLLIGRTECFFIGVNGFCKTDVLQRIFSDLQDTEYIGVQKIEDIQSFMDSKIGFAQTSLCGSLDEIIKNILSGPCALFVDGFDKAILLDARSYPARSVSEPDSERITRGARDGFVETLLYNTNLIRRRIRSPKLTFEMHSVGSDSRTDVAVAYLADSVNDELLDKLSRTIDSLNVTSLTMGAKSLEELLVKKRWWTPLPCIQATERPDVAASYLDEGHILVIVDNSPTVLILPCTVFQFTQSPEDYYKSPLVGGYFRFVRFFCIPVSLLLMPAFLLVTAYFPQFTQKWGLLSTKGLTPLHLIIYVFAVEFLLDLFKYSTSVSSSQFSSSLSIIGGLLIGDIAVSLNWASVEVLFYAAVTLLTSLSLASVEFSDALRLYRIFLIVLTAVGGKWGFIIGVTLVSFSVICTPTFGGMSYFWPLFPFNAKALGALLFRRPTSKAQPSSVWNRGHIHE